MAGFRPVKIVQVKDTFQIESGDKIFADYLDYSFDNSYGSTVTLKGKFSNSVSDGDEVIVIATNHSEYGNSQSKPSDEELLSHWFVLAKVQAIGVGEPEVTYTIKDKEFNSLSFAFYKQLNSTIVKTGEVPI